MDVLWDLNTDGVVDLIDFVILIDLDMASMIEDMEILKQFPLTSENLESLAFAIYLKEIDHDISHFKLFSCQFLMFM